MAKQQRQKQRLNLKIPPRLLEETLCSPLTYTYFSLTQLELPRLSPLYPRDLLPLSGGRPP
jgi:hypothetical protein